jgi:septal ring factor EnvC (AmiA/AmiB activator)
MENKPLDTSKDLSSVLTHVTTLEKEKQALQEHLKQQNAKLEKLTAAKRDEMKKQLDTMIAEWIKGIDVTDEKQKEEFMSGMSRIVEETKEESPVWQIMCQASAAHMRNVNQLQKVTEEYNTLRTKLEGGTFAAEESRVGSKRKEPTETCSRSGNVWDEFESMCKGGALTGFVPDETRIRELRKEWQPI